MDYVPPPGAFAASNLGRLAAGLGIGTLDELLRRARADPAWFWGEAERDLGIVWQRPYGAVLDASRGPERAGWFTGGLTNIYCSSVGRHAAANPDGTAYLFHSEDGPGGSITYGELDAAASSMAAGLAGAGISAGDAVAVYMPQVRQAVVLLMALARMGAVAVPVFSGYGGDALRARLEDSGAAALVASASYRRRGKMVDRGPAIRRAISGTGAMLIEAGTPELGGMELGMMRGTPGPPARTGSDDPLFILHTSGTTGRPKGTIQAHGGFSVFAAHQAAYVTDMRPSDRVLWPADTGWITGLVWNVYGMLLAGSGAVLYDGALDSPDPRHVWRAAAGYRATILGTSPTGARMLRAACPEPAAEHDLSSVRLVPCTGEPLDAGTWRWLAGSVGGGRAQVANLSGGTEAGGALLSALPGMPLRAGTVGAPVPGVDAACVGAGGGEAQEGHLVIRSPWPGMTRGLLGDDELYVRTYWSEVPGSWFHGDRVRIDPDGLWYVLGRSDDVVNTAGHRLSIAEIEQAALAHPGVDDAAAVSIPDETRGEAVVLFVVGGAAPGEVSDLVADGLGGIARPARVVPMPRLPKTGTGKTMRRPLRAALLGEDPGDVSALEDPAVLDRVPRVKSF
ncbi:MAG: AMP-binding protein [Nitrosopumilus sp.]|nr:AMP-binding protein [Nitrosopumilus sp.]MDA7943189.1 AMP-binding protein [Nitrosopumilus sp.]MDA7998722.1 AMP-binding protein [Nitrosopumilus sp.]